MKTLLLLQGISGSGKTTFAKQWVNEDPEGRVRLNYDDIRCMLGKYWVTEREPLVKKIFQVALHEAMFMGYDIVVDNMSNLNPKHIEEYKELVLTQNESDDELEQYNIGFKVFDTPLETCIERDSKRENPIGERVIRQQWKKYRSYIIQNSIFNMLKKQAVQDETLPHCIIVDMDATLCFNIHGREFYGEGVNEQVVYDAANGPVVEIVKKYKAAPYGTNFDTYERNHKVFIITGRDESCREGTEKWLKDYEIPYDGLFMRPVGDYTKGEILKGILYSNHIKDEYYVDFVLEDSTKVVKMYRDLGLTVLQPNEGKF